MAFASLINTLFAGSVSWFITLLIGCLTLIGYSIVSFYWTRRSYPPGPLPLPLIGNILRFRGKESIHDTLLKFSRRFGSVFTVYVGPRPILFIADYEIGAEAFKRRALAGRPKNEFMFDALIGSEGRDILMGDSDREWEVLRRVVHAATRKYSMSDALMDLVASVVDDVMTGIATKEGKGSFDPTDYVYLITFSIIARSAFGSKYNLNDPEFVKLMKGDKRFKEICNRAIVLSSIPFMKYFEKNRKVLDEFCGIFTHRRELLKVKFLEHVKTFEGADVRDFCDALIAAKIEAELEDPDNAKYLSDANLVLTLFDMFIAGTDSTRMTMTWMILFMANDPKMQSKMRSEIESVVGDNQANLDHKSKCNYVNCVIAETLRIRNVALIGHSVMEDTTIGDFNVCKGTDVFLMHNALHVDEKYWTNPEKFDPERFLDKNGVFNLRISPAFASFGIGRRACPGEKLAMTDLFLITTRLLQSTKGSMILLPNGPGSVPLDADPDIIADYIPRRYQVIIKANDI